MKDDFFTIFENNAKDEFLPDTFSHVYELECSETIARISESGVDYYDIDMVYKEAERNYNWIVKMIQNYQFKDERDTYDFFYTCSLLYYTFSALSFKKKVDEEKSTLKELIKKAILLCKKYKSFNTAKYIKEDFDIEIYICDCEPIKCFWNWKHFIKEYDSIFHINPNSEFQSKCKTEYVNLYEKGICDDECFDFNLYVLMFFADSWPSTLYTEQNKLFCQWSACSGNKTDYEKNFNNYIINYFYAYCETEVNTKGNLYNFYQRYEYFNERWNRTGFGMNDGYSYLFTTIDSYKTVCKWAIYDSLFKDSTKGLEKLINTVFGQLFGYEKKQWTSQIFEDVRKDYSSRYKNNPGVVICLTYLIRDMELSAAEEFFNIHKRSKICEYTQQLDLIKKSDNPLHTIVPNAEKYTSEIVFKDSKKSEFEKTDEELIKMMLYFSFWENIGYSKLNVCPRNLPSSSLRNYCLMKFYENYLKTDFEYETELKTILNVLAESLKFNKKNCFDSLDFSIKRSAIRIVYALSSFYQSPKDSIINLMNYVHELQFRNFPLHVDTNAKFDEPNEGVKAQKQWKRNFDFLKENDFGFAICHLGQTFSPYNEMYIKEKIYSAKNVPGVYGEKIMETKVTYKHIKPILDRKIVCKLESETDKQITVKFDEEKNKLIRYEDFSITNANNIRNHYMYDDRSMSVHERILKSILKLIEENKIRQFFEFAYEIKKYLDELLPEDDTDDDFSYYCYEDIGVRELKKKLNFFVTQIAKKIRPHSDLKNVWSECIGNQGKANFTRAELENFSFTRKFDSEFIDDLQDFLGILCITQGIVDADNNETDFISAYSTEILIYLSCLAFEFQSAVTSK